MSVPPQPTPVASPFKDVLLVALSMTTLALGVAVWQQRAEIHRLTPPPREPLAPGATLRHATAQNLRLTLPLAARAPNENSRPRANEDPGERDLPSLARVLRPPPPTARPLTRLLDNPEFFSALTLHRQATLDARFAPLFRRLDLGAEELANFKRLLAEKENVALDVVAVSEAQPDGPLPAETLQASVTAARARVEGSIRDSLGGERYEVYRDFVQTLPQRAVVAQLEQRLSYSPTPLTPTQAEALVRILVVHAPPAPAAEASQPSTVLVDATSPVVAALTENRAPVATVNNEVINEAQALLTSAQVGALREIQTEQQASARVLQLIRDNLPGDRATAASYGLLWQ